MGQCRPGRYVVRSLIVLTLITGVAWPVAANNAQERPDPVTVGFTAIQATVENRNEKHFDSGLREIRNALDGLGYDTYRQIMRRQARAPFRQETKFTINEQYTLYVTPLTREPNGRVRIETRVEKRLDEYDEDGRRKTVNALKTTSTVTPGDDLCLGGFPLDEGDLIIVFSVNRR